VSASDLLASTQTRGVATRKKLATQWQLDDLKKFALSPTLASAQKSTPPAQAQRTTTKMTPTTAQKIQKQKQQQQKKKNTRKENSDQQNAPIGPRARA